MISIGRLALIGTATLGAAATTSAASPQDDLQEVIVTGQRQAYRGSIPLDETPQAITVLDAQRLESLAITRLSDALDLSASMGRQNNFGGLWDNFAVRGFAGDENLPSGYLVNGFNAGRGFGGPRDASGIERIEILKGPSAALYGRGEPGGSVNIVTRQPDFESSGRIGLSLGSFHTRRIDADWTGPLGKSVAIRLTGFHEDAESFRDTIQTQRYGATPSLLIRFSDRTSLSYELELTRQEIPFDRGVVAVNGQLGLIPESRFLGEPGDGPLAARATGHQLQLQHQLNADSSLLLGFGHRETELSGFSSEAELAGSRQRLTRDGRTLSRQRRFRDYDTEHTVWRAELSTRLATGSVTHNLLVGADHDAFDNSQLFLRFRPPALAGNPTPAQGYVIDIQSPVYGQFTPPAPAPLTNRLDEQRAWGVYVQDHMELTERLQFRLGGRYDDFTLDAVNRSTSARSSFSDTQFSPQAGIVFEASDAISLYAAYGEGFRPNSGADALGRAFEPEASESMEIGAKLSLLDGNLAGTVSLFSMKKTNVLTADPGNPGFSIAVGEAESRGLELDLQGTLPGNFGLWLSYAYIEAEAAKDALDPNFALLIRAGDPLINVPRQTLSLQLDRPFSLGTARLKAGAGLLHVGERLGETATSFKLPSYTTARLFAAWQATDQLQFTATVDNLFDETYYTNSFAQLWVAPGAPRRATVSARYVF
jgi:iron complex outermembrane receptor protein